MKLRIKSLIISTVVTTVFIVSSLFYINISVGNKFQQLEDQRVTRDIKTVENVLSDRFIQINSKLSDWASWDDTYKYMSDTNPSYEESNLVPITFADMGIENAIYVDNNGKVVTKFSVKEGKVLRTTLPTEIWSLFESSNSLLMVDSNIGYGSGILRTDRGLVLFVVRDVLKSDGSGPPHGKLIFAKVFDEKMLEEIKSLTQFDVAIKDWDDQTLPTDVAEAKVVLNGDRQSWIKVLNSEVSVGYIKISDSMGVPQAILSIKVPRDIVLQGSSSVKTMAGTLTLFGILMVINFYWLMNVLVVRKVSQVSDEVIALTSSGKLVKRLEKTNGNDEIDKLRLIINEMLDSMQTAQIAIENSSDHVIATDIDGKILFANKAAQKLTGYSIEQMMGNTPRLWGGQMSLSFYRDMWKTIKTDKKVFSGEIINKRQNGEVYTAMATISPVLDDEGNLRGFVGVEEDITQKKKREVEKEVALDRLKKLNKLMTGRELKMVELKSEIEKLKNGK